MFPISFSDVMVRAIREGRKSQTRRLIEAQAAAEAVARAAGRIVIPQPPPLELSPSPPGHPRKCNKRRD